MDALTEYARFWLERTAVRLGHPNWHRLTERWVADIECGRPGFSMELRAVALDALSSPDIGWVHKGIAALAVVGERANLPLLRAAADRHGGAIATSARTAMFEIEHRAPAT